VDAGGIEHAPRFTVVCHAHPLSSPSPSRPRPRHHDHGR
jgi:hypothetical protein